MEDWPIQNKLIFSETAYWKGSLETKAIVAILVPPSFSKIMIVGVMYFMLDGWKKTAKGKIS